MPTKAKERAYAGNGWDGAPLPARGTRCPRCHGGAGRRACMLCAPELVPLNDYVLALLAARCWCYWVFPGWWSIDHGGSYVISVCVERELGHYPTAAINGEHPPWSPVLDVALIPRRTKAAAPDLEAACLEARFLNRDRGVDDRETDRIVSSSIGAETGRGERLL